MSAVTVLGAVRAAQRLRGADERAQLETHAVRVAREADDRRRARIARRLAARAAGAGA